MIAKLPAIVSKASTFLSTEAAIEEISGRMQNHREECARFKVAPVSEPQKQVDDITLKLKVALVEYLSLALVTSTKFKLEEKRKKAFKIKQKLASSGEAWDKMVTKQLRVECEAYLAGLRDS